MSIYINITKVDTFEPQKLIITFINNVNLSNEFIMLNEIMI